jgi:decaprenylphospho-beta-D-ribofuranose 2-oxidase
MSPRTKRLGLLLLAALGTLGIWRLTPQQGPTAPEVGPLPLLKPSLSPSFCALRPEVVQDVSLLNPAEVAVTCRPQGGDDWARAEQDIREALRYAYQSGLTVSIAGQRHSQGGHISSPGALLLDLRDYRGVRFGPDERDERIVRALSGSTWEDVQEIVNGEGLHPEAYGEAMTRLDPDGRLETPGSLAVAVQQSSNVFSIGGSLSVNCHGRDKEFGPIISTVRSFRIMLWDGRVVLARRGADAQSESARLYRAAIGGFGLFGVLLDVELDLQDNVVVEKQVTRGHYTDYVRTLTEEVIPDPAIRLHYGRFNIDELDEDNYLRDMYSVDYRTTPEIDQWEPLATETNASLNGAIMELGEWSKLAKSMRWKALLHHIDIPGTTERMTLNNAMRPQVQLLFERHGKRSINILQEYFVPLESFVGFIDGLREVALNKGINIQNITLRYVAKNEESLLSYAPTDRIAVVLYINIALNETALENAAHWTRALVDLAIANQGTYYLAYQRWPTEKQLHESYPSFKLFLQEKTDFDPHGLFHNQFYGHYGSGLSETKQALPADKSTPSTPKQPGSPPQ